MSNSELGALSHSSKSRKKLSKSVPPLMRLINYGHNYRSKIRQAIACSILNKIFDWYTDQFVDNAGSLINYVNKYRFYKVPKHYKVEFQEYDWSLNDR